MPSSADKRPPLPATVYPLDAMTASNADCPPIEAIELWDGWIQVQKRNLPAPGLRALVFSAIGMMDKQIAANIGVHPDTISELQRETLDLLGAYNRPHAVDISFDEKILIPRRAITLPDLPARQNDILELAAEGVEPKNYGDVLAIEEKVDKPISLATSRTHEAKLMRKLGAPTMASAVLLANMDGKRRPIPRYKYDEWRTKYMAHKPIRPEDEENTFTYEQWQRMFRGQDPNS